VGVIYAAVVVSFVGHGLFFVLVRRHPIARVTPYLLATPVLTTVLGAIVLGDKVGPRLVAGGALVLSGVAILALVRPSESKK
jgi:O-acetylserine/cysteine efflux transporter